MTQSESVSRSTRFGVTPVLMLAYCVYYLSDTWGSRFETQGYGALCASILGGLVAILVVRSFLQGTAFQALRDWCVARPAVAKTHLSAALMAASLSLYAWGQEKLGFVVATAVVFTWLLVFLRAGSPVRIMLLALLLTALAWGILLELLNVPLPRSPWAA